MLLRNERAAGIWIPKQAALAGHVNNVFFDGFDTIGTIDKNNTGTGSFNWWVGNIPQYAPSPFLQGNTGVAPSASWFTVANSILTISSNQTYGQGAEVMSFQRTGANTYVRNVPLIDGSQGFYIEGLMKFALPSGEDFIPDFWMQDISGTMAQIQSSGSFRFGELDIFEGRPPGTGAVQTVVDWSNWDTNTAQRSGSSPNSGLDYSLWHRWGAKLTTMAQGGGTGSVTWYVDDASTGTPLTWTHTTDLGAILESGRFEINFAAGNTTPLEVDYIGVWQ